MLRDWEYRRGIRRRRRHLRKQKFGAKTSTIMKDGRKEQFYN